ncbi:hypothetical protein D3C84_945790 [compost metagenome]
MGEHVAQAPAAPGVDPDDQQMPARTHATRRFAQQTMGRQAEIQAVLQHHYIGSVLAQRPGLLFTHNLDTRQWRTQPHIALDLRRRRRCLGRRTVMHQIATEEASQLVFEHASFFVQQKLPDGAGQPFTGRADQGQPVRISLSERFISHCILQRARKF